MQETYVKDTGKPPPRPPEPKIGEEVSAIEAIYRRGTNFDTRPKVYNSMTKSYVLLDTGSCVSCTPKQENDIEDPYFKLKSVNGGSIATYGTRKIEWQMGRKRYCVEAIIAEVPQQIIGWDAFKIYLLP